MDNLLDLTTTFYLAVKQIQIRNIEDNFGIFFNFLFLVNPYIIFCVILNCVKSFTQIDLSTVFLLATCSMKSCTEAISRQQKVCLDMKRSIMDHTELHSLLASLLYNQPNRTPT